MHKAYLILEDGSIFEGNSIGFSSTKYGEVVFNTSMTGYQEILTDPSYSGQIVVATYPLIGNYGINSNDSQSKQIQVKGYVIREYCEFPSHYDSELDLDTYLKDNDIPGIFDIDTRAVTKKLRFTGSMMGCITNNPNPEEELKNLLKQPHYLEVNHVLSVSSDTKYNWEQKDNSSLNDLKIAVIDCGVKFNILKNLSMRGCKVEVFPVDASLEKILENNPDGIVISPGPGDPSMLDQLSSTVEELIKVKPTFGICLGNQLIARALGANTFKLKFGHHGANHPVKDLRSGKVTISSQNHGFAIDPDTLPNDLSVSHVNLIDGTVEGIEHNNLPVMGIQFHSEASPGPLDNTYLFDRFIEKIKEEQNG